MEKLQYPDEIFSYAKTLKELGHTEEEAASILSSMVDFPEDVEEALYVAGY